MSTVKVTFYYEPDEPDDEDETGMSADEYDRVTERLIGLGADNMKFERVPDGGR